MKRLGTYAAALFLLALAVPAAQAGILELRGGVGLTAPDDDTFEDRGNAVPNNGIQLDEFDVYNADIFFNLPAIPLGVGVRQEWIDVDEDSNGSELDLEATNLSLLVDIRIIDSAFYIGPIFGVGHPSADLNYKTGTFTLDKDLDADDLSYTAGLEAGVILGHFLIGAEGGYQSIKFESTDDPTVNASLDLSGVYGKVMVGLTFF